MNVVSQKSLPFLCAVLAISFFSEADARRGEAPRSQSDYANTVKSLRQVPVKAMTRVDAATLLREDAAQPKGTPLRIGVAEPVNVTPDKDAWEPVANGGQIWRYRFNAENATDLQFVFKKFRLPPGATLHVISEDYDYYEGPYTVEDATSSGRFYPPLVPGSKAVVEVFLPSGTEDYELEIESVQKGYRDFLGMKGSPNLSKVDFCDNDVICPEGDPWRDEIRSVAHYTFVDGPTFVCTGSLIMDAESSFKPHFLTAYHCMSSQSVVDTATYFWNFESPVCGQRGGGSKNQNQTGATLRATREDVDMTLLELAQEPDEAFNVHYAGWDASGNTPQSSVAIHHPAGEVKVISFNEDPLTSTSSCIGPNTPNTHWEVDDWEDGTTAGGSSGSGLWDPANKRIVGFLSGGLASCTTIDFDCYGKVSVAWNGANSGARLRDWLDPNNTGITGIDGSDKVTVVHAGKMSVQDDANNSGAGEVMSLRVQNNAIKVQVSDGNSGATIGDPSFLSDSWTAQNVFGMPALPGGSTSSTAVLATQNSDDLPIVQLKNPSDGSLINNLFPWSTAWNILDVDTVPGAASGGGAALATLASRKSDGLMGVELRDPSNNVRIRLIYPLGFGWSAINVETVNVNGQWAVATLATRDADGLAIVQVRDATTGNLVKNVFPLGLGWTPREVKAIPDLDGNGVDEVGVRMTRDSDGLELIQIRDSLTNNLVSNVYPIGAGAGGWSTQQFEVVDINGVAHLGILSIADSNAQVLVQIRNAATAAIVRNVFFIGPPYEFMDYATLADVNNTNAGELAVLVRNSQSDLHIIQVRDASNGNLIRNVFQPQ